MDDQAVILARWWDAHEAGLILGSLLDSAYEVVSRLRDVRQCDILAARLGLDGEPPTLADLGQKYGVSRERIRQIQSQALTQSVRITRRNRPNGSLADQVDALMLCMTPDNGAAFVEIAATLSQSGATPVFIELLRRLTGESKEQLGLIRERLTQSRLAERRRLTDAAHDEWIATHIQGPAWWPKQTRSWDPQRFERVREVDYSGIGLAGDFTSSKLGRDVQYESLLELGLMRRLEAAPTVLHYQEQPVTIPYEWQGRDRRYVPDLLVWLTDGRTVLIEVKPVLHMIDSINQAKFGAAHRWCIENGIALLITDGRVGTRQLHGQVPLSGVALGDPVVGLVRR